MYQPENIESKLSFEKIKSTIKSFCKGNIGLKFTENIKFLNDGNKIKEQLGLTGEMISLLASSPALPDFAGPDITEYPNKIKPVGSFLSENEAFDVLITLKNIRSCLLFFMKKEQEEFHQLIDLGKEIQPLDTLFSALSKTFDENGKIADSASVELKKIRKNIRSESAKLRKRTDEILKNAIRDKNTAADSNPTVRNGRLVIPVIAERKRRINGLIHDESASGKTVFIEPAETLEINNRIKEAEHLEQREIIRILTELSNNIRAESDHLPAGTNYLGHLDFIRAKAQWAINHSMNVPEVVDRPIIDYKNAFHPLLKALHDQRSQPTVPLDITLTPEQRIMVISGPNAGGKSICLKTVGLLQYMVQCGLPVTADERSVFGVFDQILADIGDEQSVENDLSTYSSHLVNMKKFIQTADEKTLFLLDEFGTGTEPKLGAAVAQSVLEELRNKKALGVVTTHYDDLKNYAENSEGTINGSMRFDTTNLKPLYQLEIGKPGRSYTFEIARNIGLPKKIVARAEEIAGRETVDLEKMLAELESERASLKIKTDEISQQEKELDRLTKEYSSLKRALTSRKSALINQAKEEAELLLKNASKKIEETVRAVRESKADDEKIKTARNKLEEFTRRTKKKLPEVRIENPSIKTIPGKIVVGDVVRIKGTETTGKVQAIFINDAELIIGSLKSFVKLNRLERIQQSAGASKRQTFKTSGIDKIRRKAEFTSSIDFRGLRAHEVLIRLEEFMNNALLADASELRILHGKGDGILRKIIREKLKEYTAVTEIADEHADRGGWGITIVKLI